LPNAWCLCNNILRHFPKSNSSLKKTSHIIGDFPLHCINASPLQHIFQNIL
jgi:hypothetical protein